MTLARDTREAEVEIELLAHVSKLHSQLGNTDKALAIIQDLRSRELTLQQQLALGKIFNDLGEYEEANMLFEELVAQAVLQDDIDSTIQIHMEMGAGVQGQ